MNNSKTHHLAVVCNFDRIAKLLLPKAQSDRRQRSAASFRESNKTPASVSRLAMALVLLLVGRASAADVQTAADAAKPAAESGIDSSIQPGDDFYSYANGDWLKATEIPKDKGRWSARDDIGETTKRQLADLFGTSVGWPAGSYQRKVADFYTAYLAENVIEGKGIAPIRALLDRIDLVHDKAALMRQLGADLRADVDPLNFGVFDSSSLLGLSVERGIHGEKNHFAYLLQGGLGLVNRDMYLDTSSKAQAQRLKYREYISHMLELAGFDHAPQRAIGVLALETAIAENHATSEESSDERNADNHWTLADFSAKAPGMDWPVFFAAAGLAKQQDFVVWQQTAIKGAAALVATQPLEVWKDYLRFHLIDRYADVLPRVFAESASAMRAGDSPKVSGGRKENALEATNRALPEAVGRMYVDKYFSPAAKAKAETIRSNVIRAFETRIETVQWMSPATKKLALSRLNTLYFGVGYPDKWTDHSRLTIDAGDALGNVRRISAWNYENSLAKLEQPVDRTEWMASPQAVGAVYQPLQNAYNFSAALMQAPKFDPTATDATNYGSIGAIFGHEISHFVDRLGADYDDAGAKHHWWTDEDNLRFDQSCAALVTQFSAYKPFPDLAVDGKLTLSENIADLGGLAAAFDAYRHSLGSKVRDKKYVRQQDRQFFVAFARAWRVKMQADAMRKQTATSDHAPENYRISTVRNIGAWYEAFDVVPGQRLYLAPENRVRIW